MSLVSFSKGVSYTLSGNPITDNSVQTFLESGGMGIYDKGYGKTFTPTKDFESKVTILVNSGSSLNNVIVKPLLEIGTTATEFEACVQPTTYTADENGKVEGIIGNGEDVTLIGVNGVIISAEYNKDTNKVIECLVNAIISLGGNV